ncbi:CHAP domain-containing protein [Novosphingobium mangrovi (ex Hu et al. 2023)]|uniref:CHAP domain-containing protein n=1 Tax=Novosphingobium mangrovi (ex Hu et al. 2023) TaxID=2930094 RepID=A0ABT0AH87_9SPHN|nr:CHAP domain-containing protein [Novosphingobium mangrovi (ex Hu et al. 2023)]MCJ1962543.1 CHAP domain-containing protein [Novosphingobium mangrovi (ex Hu et al. 2023)]
MAFSLATAGLFAAPAGARADISEVREHAASGLLECVPFAREVSGIRLSGDAYTWWTQAKGRYARGHTPRVGAVMAIRPHGNSHNGHVAMVSEVIDSRTVLLTHANWSYPGKVERDVAALDVSPMGDWSEVRIWYGPSQTLGASHWPVDGFIYNASPDTQLARMEAASANRSEDTKTIRAASSSRSDPIGTIIAGAF